MNDIQLLEMIRNAVEEHNLTAYEIGKNTEISTFAISNILSGKTKKPYRGTLLKILAYLEENVTGIDVKKNHDVSSVSEPHSEYNNSNELLASYKKQIFLFEKNMYLYEENANLYRENAGFLREKVACLTAKMKS